MSFVGSLFNGSQGAGYQAQAAPIQTAVTPQQLQAQQAQAQAAYQQGQGGLQQQQDLLNALAAQNGIQNQSNVYNQLQNVASGTGPNPAQAMLAQSTGTNVANQAALMAGQRGAGANVGLEARQAAQQGANTQQQAAGQAATLQANQSLNALGQLGGLATQQVGQQIGAVQGVNQVTQAQQQAAQANQQQMLNAIAAQNQANVGMQGNINSANAQIAGINTQGQYNLVSNLTGAGGSALGLAEGGEIPSVPQQSAQMMMKPIQSPSGPKSKVAQLMMAKGGQVYPADRMPTTSMYEGGKFGPTTPEMGYAKGGKVPALVSPGEVYLPPEKVKKVAKEGKNPLSVGEKIPGKPKYPGNDYRNDILPKTLESGGVIIPNKVMQSKNPAKEASKFVAAILAGKGLKR